MIVLQMWALHRTFLLRRYLPDPSKVPNRERAKPSGCWPWPPTLYLGFAHRRGCGGTGNRQGQVAATIPSYSGSSSPGGWIQPLDDNPEHRIRRSDPVRLRGYCRLWHRREYQPRYSHDALDRLGPRPR